MLKQSIRDVISVRFDDVLAKEDGTRLKVVCGRISFTDRAFADEKKAVFVGGFENSSTTFKLVDIGETETERAEVARQCRQAEIDL